MESFALQEKGLLRLARSAAKAQKSTTKGIFDLQWQVLLRQAVLSVLQCCYRSIVAVAKSAAIDLPFRGAFGLLRRANTCHHMRFTIRQVAFQRRSISAAIGLHVQHILCTFQQRVINAAISLQLYHNFSPLVAVFARRYRIFFFFFSLLGSKTTFLLQITCNNFSSYKTIPQM